MVSIPYVALGEGRLSLPPFGTFGLDLRTAVPMPWILVPRSGKTSIRFSIPRVPGHRGLSLCFQALMVDLLGPAHLSNLVSDVIQ